MTADLNQPAEGSLESSSVPAPLDANAVWHAFYEPLSAFIRKRMPSRSDADDVLQQVFTRIQRSAASGAEVRHVSGWVHSIARNAIADYYRATSSDAARDESYRHEANDREEPPNDDDEAAAELSKCVRPFLAQLPEQQRQALELTDLGTLSQADAAKQLGLSPSGMKSRVQRGRANLRNLIAGCCSIELDSRQKVVDYKQRTSASDCGCGPSDDSNSTT